MTRQKIVFYPTIPGIDKTMPILSADKIIHNWKQEAAREFKNQKNNLGHTIHSISNCPGINTLSKQAHYTIKYNGVLLLINRKLTAVRQLRNIKIVYLKHFSTGRITLVDL
jgi:hypothetical protein